MESTNLTEREIEEAASFHAVLSRDCPAAFRLPAPPIAWFGERYIVVFTKSKRQDRRTFFNCACLWQNEDEHVLMKFFLLELIMRREIYVSHVFLLHAEKILHPKSEWEIQHGYISNTKTAMCQKKEKQQHRS